MHTFIALLEDLELLEKDEAAFLAKKIGSAIKPADYVDAKRQIAQFRKEYKDQK